MGLQRDVPSAGGMFDNQVDRLWIVSTLVNNHQRIFARFQPAGWNIQSHAHERIRIAAQVVAIYPHISAIQLSPSHPQYHVRRADLGLIIETGAIKCRHARRFGERPPAGCRLFPPDATTHAPVLNQHGLGLGSGGEELDVPPYTHRCNGIIWANICP